ncbi:hypothetical protein [Rahnella sp. ChDrAdgB13]|uniref:hypothetical protein n=1 Tax=Rahnella sp. ChDrAdgB13 TaxID=1850581 RepID=UPI001AD85100|nr:hypothetical protein [Rahnella sp. ChDrAdgB13]
MKYEITKGSEKDFEGAIPLKQLNMREGNFLDGRKYIHQNILFKDRETVYQNGYIIAERRQITEPVWDGEGLPPVGVECEWLDNGTYIPVKIAYSSKEAIVIRGKSKIFNEEVEMPLDPVLKPEKCRFRPIRSPDDVARDEVVDALYATLSGQSRTVCREVYDAIAAGKIPGVKLE